MCRYVVVKGRNTIIGKSGCDYSIFDIVSFPDELKPKVLETAMRKYVFQQLYYVDKKSAKNLRHDTWSRRRHIMKHDGTALVKNIRIFDTEGGIFYGFIPLQSFEEYEIV